MTELAPILERLAAALERPPLPPDRILWDAERVAVGNRHHEADDKCCRTWHYLPSPWAALAFFFGFLERDCSRAQQAL